MVADRIRQTLSSLEPVDRLGRRMPSPTVSQGIATLGEDASDADQLVDVADQALYRAKEQGRDRVVVTGWQ
jgi:diguanylate cyclase (GGDEF)-like protein